MSSDAHKKSPLADPLLILIALLLVIAAAATLYFNLEGASKSYALEPGARPRPVITNQVVIVNVQEVVAAPAGGEGHSAPSALAKVVEAAPAPEAPKPVAPSAPSAAAVALKPPAVSANTDGRVRGRVFLRGTPPPESVIGAVKSDANCGKVAVGTAKSRNYVTSADSGLRYVLARIVKAPAGAAKAPESTLIDQAGCMYEPYISAIMVGETLKIRNSDPFMHNVNCTPKDPKNKGFNISQPTQGQVNDKVFENPELGVRFACNVHPWMIAYVHILENPFFAVTNDKGEFELPAGLPPGKYELEIQHPKAGIAKQEVEIAAGRGADVVFELAPAAAK